MQIIVGSKKQNLIIETDTLVTGNVEGNIKVLSGAKLNLTGRLHGDLHLCKHSVVSIQNKVFGNVYDHGSSIEIVNAEIKGEIIRR